MGAITLRLSWTFTSSCICYISVFHATMAAASVAVPSAHLRILAWGFSNGTGQARLPQGGWQHLRVRECASYGFRTGEFADPEDLVDKSGRMKRETPPKKAAVLRVMSNAVCEQRGPQPVLFPASRTWKRGLRSLRAMNQTLFFPTSGRDQCGTDRLRPCSHPEEPGQVAEGCSFGQTLNTHNQV